MRMFAAGNSQDPRFILFANASSIVTLDLSLERDSCCSFTAHLTDMCAFLLAPASNLALLITLDVILQVSLVCRCSTVMNALSSHTHGGPKGCITGLLTPLNDGETSTHGLVLQSVVRSLRIWVVLVGSRREEMVMITIAYGLRHDLDKDLIEAGMWPPYTIIINTFEGRRCRPST
jgi:hypothetical protein